MPISRSTKSSDNTTDGAVKKFQQDHNLECSHIYMVLYLVGLVRSISDTTGFDLQAHIDQQRAAVLAADEPEPGGWA